MYSGTSVTFDGPEKAGKSTIIKMLWDKARHMFPNVHVVKYTTPAPNGDWSYYAEEHKKHYTDWISKGHLVIYDRSWMSELVYGKLMTQRPINVDEQMNGFLLNRSTVTIGKGIVLLGPNAKRLASLRDRTDLPVDPALERKTFKLQADYFGWEYYQNEHNQVYSDNLVNHILLDLATDRKGAYRMAYHNYVGNFHERQLIVFDKNMLTDFGLIRDLGSVANHTAYTNINLMTPTLFRSARKVVFCNIEEMRAAGVLARLKELKLVSSYRGIDLMKRTQKDVDQIKDYLS